jgi:hypothetical protein
MSSPIVYTAHPQNPLVATTTAADPVDFEEMAAEQNR